MKLAYLGPTGVFGGVRIIVEHCNRLGERGHDVTLIGTGDQPVTWLPCNFEQRPASDPGAGYEVVVGTAISNWPQAVTLAAGTRVFGLLQMADWLFQPKGSAAYETMLAQFTAPVEVLAISEWLAQLAEAAGHTTHRIRNGIDTGLFFHDEFPDVPPFDGVTVVTEGYSHNPAKDVDEYTKRAIRHMKWDLGRPVRAVGFSQYPPAFEYDNYWQSPPQPLIRKIYSAGDVFLKASRYEGRPGPDLEAMACGAVVCRAIGTGADDLFDRENCMVTGYGSPEDYEQFVDNLVFLADNPDFRAHLRANALEYIKTRCDWPGAIDLVEQALTGSVTAPKAREPVAYTLADYNAMQEEIVGWETPQAMWLGETLAEMLEPESVIDIGCGPGVYLTPFKPAARVLGVDGAPDAGKALEPDEYVTVDLRDDGSFSEITDAATKAQLNPGTLNNPTWPADLSLCIEVAEHLPPDRADYLVRLLTSCSDNVFFSAAHPGQGGTLHLNEQPPEYWLERFRSYGFDLHSDHTRLKALIAANPHCQRVQWLLPNAMLLTRMERALVTAEPQAVVKDDRRLITADHPNFLAALVLGNVRVRVAATGEAGAITSYGGQYYGHGDVRNGYVEVQLDESGKSRFRIEELEFPERILV